MTGRELAGVRPASRVRLTLAGAALLSASAACDPPDPGPAGRTDVAYLRIVAAEDARPAEGPDLDHLLRTTEAPAPSLRRAAVRALGRLERPELVPSILPALTDEDAGVRAEAANALAQSVHRADGDAVASLLAAHAEDEQDPAVRSALARSIGRTASSPAARAQAGTALLDLSRVGGLDAPVVTLVGVALGFESLVRGAGGQGLGGAEARRLAELTEPDRLPGGVDATRVRTVAYTALGQARRIDARAMARLVDDPDPAVRHVGARYLDGVPPIRHDELLEALLADTAQVVRIAALQRLGSEARAAWSCAALLASAAAAQPSAVRVIALDGLGRSCPQRREQRELLAAAAAEVSDGTRAWQPAAHALMALTRIDPEAAESALPGFASSGNPFVRAYAARAAGALGSRELLGDLTEDPDPNVRTAAIQALTDLDGRGARASVVEQLGSDDPQLLLTAARLLEGSGPDADVAGALLDAFERISAARRETWRDPRVALLQRLAEVGDPGLEARLAPYLTDYDPAVAELVARTLEGWTGRVHRASPDPPAPRPPPTPRRYRSLVDALVDLHMKSGDTITIRLAPHGATMNVDRFARLAEDGYFDGLTFHRWAPNFVIQGGSPGANEYQGAGPFSRDELGLDVHWRGTVGISTRGRDTGDAQIFVNLVDNVRLDHDYTIVGEVVAGMDAVDRVLEGAVIERAVVRTGR